MSTILAIMGQTGSGKTTALRNLDPASTFIIDADRKGLSWQGWKQQYVEGKNYLRESHPDKVRKALQVINEKTPRIKTVVIDTANAIMVDDEIRRMKEKGFDKWIDLAQAVYSLIDESAQLRDDLVVCWIFWAEVQEDERGEGRFIRFQTSGRKLQKITLEAKFPTVLLVKQNEDGEFVFETQSRQSAAKTPMGMFENLHIPNDLQPVIERIKEYEGTGAVQAENTELTESLKEVPVSAADRLAAREKARNAPFEKLEELQQKDGINNLDLVQYLKGRKMITGNSIIEISTELLNAMIQPTNWEKIRTEILKNKPTSEELGRESASGRPRIDWIRNKMKKGEIEEVHLTSFLREKGMIEPKQHWHEGKPELHKAIIEQWGTIAPQIYVPF